MIFIKGYPTGATATVMDCEVQQHIERTLAAEESEAVADVIRRGKISLDTVLEVNAVALRPLASTDTLVVTLADAFGTGTAEMYLHRKFQLLVGTPFLPPVQESEFAFANDLKGGRGNNGGAAAAAAAAAAAGGGGSLEHRFRFSGCKLAADRTTKYRFIPAEFGVVLLQYDEDHQGNVDFIREQFTAHTLVQVPLNESYFVLAKVEEIGAIERVRT